MKRYSRSSVLGVVIVSFALSACGAHTPATTRSSPEQLLNAALNDATDIGSAHETESFQRSGRTETFSDDVGVIEGRQEITLAPGMVAHVRVIGGVAYISGNQTVLTKYFGFPAATSRAVGSRWVSFLAPSRAYSVVAYDATLDTALAGLELTGRLTETPPTTFSGEPVIGIRGTALLPGPFPPAVDATVYLSRSRKPLPVGATYSFTNGAIAKIVMDRWGEHFALQAPTDVISPSVLEHASGAPSLPSHSAAPRPPNPTEHPTVA
jgi:hypothetical protein